MNECRSNDIRDIEYLKSSNGILYLRYHWERNFSNLAFSFLDDESTMKAHLANFCLFITNQSIIYLLSFISCLLYDAKS